LTLDEAVQYIIDHRELLLADAKMHDPLAISVIINVAIYQDSEHDPDTLINQYQYFTTAVERYAIAQERYPCRNQVM